MSDQDLQALILTAINLQNTNDTGRVVYLADKGLCYKSDFGYTSDSEVLIYDLVYKHTTIPVPRVHRILSERGPLAYGGFFMDHIPGRPLEEVWPSLSIFGKLRVIFTLRHYISQLRAIKHSRAAIPGPVADGEDARVCDCPMVFGQVIPKRGPFATYAALSDFCNNRNAQALAELGDSNQRVQPFDDSMPLVLSHCDLNLRNIIVGDDGKLWMIDWGFSGFYPRWFEFLAMRDIYRYPDEEEQEVVGTGWKWAIPFICGPYFKQERWWRRMARTLHHKS